MTCKETEEKKFPTRNLESCICSLRTYVIGNRSFDKPTNLIIDFPFRCRLGVWSELIFDSSRFFLILLNRKKKGRRQKTEKEKERERDRELEKREGKTNRVREREKEREKERQIE